MWLCCLLGVNFDDNCPLVLASDLLARIYCWTLQRRRKIDACCKLIVTIHCDLPNLQLPCALLRHNHPVSHRSHLLIPEWLDLTPSLIFSNSAYYLWPSSGLSAIQILLTHSCSALSRVYFLLVIWFHTFCINRFLNMQHNSNLRIVANGPEPALSNNDDETNSLLVSQFSKVNVTVPLTLAEMWPFHFIQKSINFKFATSCRFLSIRDNCAERTLSHSIKSCGISN